MLCAPGAQVIWTRGRPSARPGEPGGHPSDITGQIRARFAGAGFSELAWEAPSERSWSVGIHRYDGPPVGFEPGRRMLVFIR